MTAFAFLVCALAATPSQADEGRARRRTPVVDVVERAGPAVVNIATEIGGNPFARRRGQSNEWQRLFGGPDERRQQSLGSGVIIDASGLVLTNEHVVSESSNITVTLADRRTFEADVVGSDPSFDIAVLKIRAAKDLPTAHLGSSDDLMAGESVVAIGNPFGLANTVTTGVVSALHRSIEARDRAYEDFIQTDAAINPGNSGGALLNIEGELIGINTAIHNSGQGIGFAIPITKAKAVVEEVLRYGEVRPIYSGLLVTSTSEPGAKIYSVRQGSPGEEAGLKSGDLIVDASGQEVRTPRAYRHFERSLVPGTKVRLTVVRGSERPSVTMTVRELSPNQAAEIGRARLGLAAALQRGNLTITSVDPKSHAAQIGIKKGDFLLALGGLRPKNEAELAKLLAQIHDAESVTGVIGRGGRAYYVTLELKE